MKFFLLKREDGRFEVYEKRWEEYKGLLIAGYDLKDGGNFWREFGTTYLREDCVDIDEYPELKDVKYFAIDYGKYEGL